MIPLFIPTTREEFDKLGWDQADIILVNGDTYIDSPYIGMALIGKVLLDAGYKVGIIAQPGLEDAGDITRLGEPALFWGISGGCMDSMVANYTASGKFRRQDDLTPGGQNNKRPDRAVIKYANLIRRFFKRTVPLVLGGVEASLRRVPHYDFWDNKIRNSLLFDAKGDLLIYGMGEKTVLALSACLREQRDYRGLRGLCYISGEPVAGYERLPAAEEVKKEPEAFTAMFHTFYRNSEPRGATGMVQQQGTRYLIHNPPAEYESTAELDHYYNLPFTRDAHPYYKARGKIRALDTIRFSLTTHRGCYGECNFCALAVHQGKTIRSRSRQSILAEAGEIAALPDFKGYLTDVGGATANMYGFECPAKQTRGPCPSRRCLYPAVCPHLPLDHTPQLRLLADLAAIPGIKKVFVASGIRHDLVLADRKAGRRYLETVLRHHTSGQLKIAPEHACPRVLALMGKPDISLASRFRALFESLNRSLRKKQFLTYYFIAAYPGCDQASARTLQKYLHTHLRFKPEQVQIFTPTPSTYATLMYYTGKNPFTGEKIFVEKEKHRKEWQKKILL